MSNNCGTYIVKCGNTAYIGSSSNFQQRKSSHKRDLERGIHPNQNLQQAFDGSQDFSFIPHQYITPVDCPNELRTILRNAEQTLLDEAAKSNLWVIANVSQNAFGPHARPDMVARWQDQEFRKQTLNRLHNRVVTDETKRKMSLAKQGANNSKARKVIVTNPDGSETIFSTTTEAAQFFRISQQLLHLMLKGKTAWPGKGKFIRNKENEWMREYEARLV
jgi:group I intron endonuclease